MVSDTPLTPPTSPAGPADSMSKRNLESLLALQDVMLASISSYAPLPDVMYALCKEVERREPEIVVAMLRVDEQRVLRPLASPSLTPAYDQHLDGMPITSDVGTCGIALIYGRPHFTRDIEADPNWVSLRHLVQPLGLCSCWSHPIKRRDGRIIGSLAFYYRRQREPNAFDHELAEICLRICTLAFESADMQSSLQKFAYYDVVTGLPNRALLEKELERVLFEAARDGSPFSLLFIDLDGFKDVNDTYGHPRGDEILRRAAQRIMNILRGTDFVGRFGGDEFLAVLRHGDIPRVRRIAERIVRALREPFLLQACQAGQIQLGASIGVALYPVDGVDAETVLQRADIAMYRAKKAGRNQVRFHRAPDDPPENPASAAVADAPGADAALLPQDDPSPYGRQAANALNYLVEALQPRIAAVVSQFYADFAAQSSAEHLLDCLTPEEFDKLKARQAERLLQLCAPHLTQEQQEAGAHKVGRIHAMIGLSSGLLVHSLDSLYTCLRQHVDIMLHDQALAIVNRRLIKDIGWQLEAAQKIALTRLHALSELRQLCWSARNYNDLFAGAVEIMVYHEGIAGCMVLRLDAQNLLRAQAQAGSEMAALLQRIENQQNDWLQAGEDPLKPGPTERAWRTGMITHCQHFATDAIAHVWQPVLAGMEIRSCIAIPIFSPSTSTVMSILVQFSRFPGEAYSQERNYFLEQVQALLSFGINRLEAWKHVSGAIPHSLRHHWLALLQDDGLEMYYQPIMDLRTGKVHTVEALARLRDHDNLFAPGQFLSAFSSEDLYQLYAKGLRQVLEQRALWAGLGLDLNLSLNLPIAGLEDARYLMATEQILREFDCARGVLTLEILEDEEISSRVNLMETLRRYKALGVDLAEDDLGSGHSSLSRLQEMPFDIIKIDRGILNRIRSAPFNTLRFIYQLTRLGHGLGKRVIAEGVEDCDLLHAIALLGTDAVQGYVISRPLPARALQAWIRQPPSVTLGEQAAPGPLSRLAKLLIWEEAQHVLSDKALGRAGLARMHKRMHKRLRYASLRHPADATPAAASLDALARSASRYGLYSREYLMARDAAIARLLEA